MAATVRELVAISAQIRGRAIERVWYSGASTASDLTYEGLPPLVDIVDNDVVVQMTDGLICEFSWGSLGRSEGFVVNLSNQPLPESIARADDATDRAIWIPMIGSTLLGLEPRSEISEDSGRPVCARISLVSAGGEVELRLADWTRGQLIYAHDAIAVVGSEAKT